MGRLITDASDYRHTLADGYGWLTFEMEPDGRVRVTGAYGPSLSEAEAAYGSTHSIDSIAQLILALEAIVSRARRNS